MNLLKNLVDMFGMSETVIMKVIEYLRFYGYLRSGPIVNIVSEIIPALMEWKRSAGLLPGAYINQTVIDKMNEPRCGCSDVQRSIASVEESRWRKNKLNYWIASYVNGISQQDQNDIIRMSWDQWESVADIKLTQVTSQSQADIVVATGRGASQGFDGPSGTLAWAQLPNGNDNQLLMRYDLDETWLKELTATQRGILMLNVSTHEQGHLLGLDHSRVSSALMAPYYSPAISKPQQNDDIPRIQALYGKPVAPVPIPDPTPIPNPVPGWPVTVKVYQDGRIEIPGYSIIRIP